VAVQQAQQAIAHCEGVHRWEHIDEEGLCRLCEEEGAERQAQCLE